MFLSLAWMLRDKTECSKPRQNVVNNQSHGLHGYVRGNIYFKELDLIVSNIIWI